MSLPPVLRMLGFSILLVCLLSVSGYSRWASHFHPSARYAHGLNEHVDIDSTFSPFDRLLFNRFSLSVASEMNLTSAPASYQELIFRINQLTESRPTFEVNDAGKNMLTRLFPAWLLKQYQWMFARPFPQFSAWMNAWVTHWTTQWLMGNSSVIDLPLPDGSLAFQQGLKIEKCRFLETSGCLQTCIHACKIPTQRFFLEEMGLPVTLSPNISDYSCTFEFGFAPLPLEDDPIASSSCLPICSKRKTSQECGILTK